MNRFAKTALSAALAAVFAVSLSSCGLGQSGGNEPVSSASEPESSASEPESSASEPESSASEPESSASEPESSASEPESSASEPESSVPQKEHAYVKNGRFSLPDGAFSFKLEEGWKMTDDGMTWQFDNEEQPYNNFNLVAAETYASVEDTTEDQMLGTYQTMMTDFQLIDFQHIKVAGMPAVFMQISGKYSMMTTETVIYQYAVQSGDMLYTLSFSQGGTDDGFSDMITGLIGSIEITPADNGEGAGEQNQ